MKSVGIVIPTKNSERTIGACLDSIQKQSYSRITVVVVDNASTDKTPSIVRRHKVTLLKAGPERSAQRNVGAKHCNADYLLFIDSDMVLESGVVEECVQCLENNQAFKSVVIPEYSIGIGFWARCKALERSYYLNQYWLEAPRFFSKKTFMKFKGYDENNTGTEDYDLPQRIELEYGHVSRGRVDSFISHDEGKLDLGKTMKKKFYYGKKLATYAHKVHNASNFKMQSSIFQRYKLFFSSPPSLEEMPIFIGMLLMKTLEFIAGGLGYLFSAQGD